MKVSEWLGMEAKPQRGIMKKKPQRGRKHQVSDKDKNRLGEMWASMRLKNAPITEFDDQDKGKCNIQSEESKRSDLMLKVERSPGECIVKHVGKPVLEEK